MGVGRVAFALRPDSGECDAGQERSLRAPAVKRGRFSQGQAVPGYGEGEGAYLTYGP